MKKKEVLRALIEVAICAAIAFILDLIQSLLFGSLFISGGSIGIAMLPIIVVAYRRGLGYALLCGLIVSCIQLIGEPIYIINGADYSDTPFLSAIAPVVQVALDYFLAYTLVGFAGVFKHLYDKSTTNASKCLYVALGCILGGGLKYICHVLSGGLFWMNCGSSFWNINDDTWLFTFIYNGAYCIPNILIAIGIMILFAIVYPVILNSQKTIYHHTNNDDNKQNNDEE